MLVKNKQPLDLVCEAIADSIHYPQHLAYKWLVKYGHVSRVLNSDEIRQQLRKDFIETKKDMQQAIAEADRSAAYTGKL